MDLSSKYVCTIIVYDKASILGFFVQKETSDENTYSSLFMDTETMYNLASKGCINGVTYKYRGLAYIEQARNR